MAQYRMFCMKLALCAVFALTAMLPPQIFAQTEKGIELYNSWEYKEAEKVLRDALKANPRDVPANFYLGLSILLQEKYSEALDLFLKAKDDRGKSTQLTPSNVPDEFQIQIALARAHLGLDQFAEAWENLESAKKLNADAPDVFVYRGVYYLHREKQQKAVKELEKAIRLDEHNVYAHYYAGHAYLRLGNAARAVDMFKIFLNLAPYAPEAPKAKALIDALC